MDTYQADPRTVNAYATLSRRFQGVLLGFLAYRAGRNHYDLTHDLGDSIYKGATALRRWWFWIFFTKLWLLWAGVFWWNIYLRNHKIRGESFQDFDGSITQWVDHSKVLLIPAFVLGVAIPYVRNVDFSLFKRRLFYKLFRPLAVVVDSLPVAALYACVGLGLFNVAGWF